MKYVGTYLYVEFKELVLAGVKEETVKLAKHRGSAAWSFIDDPEDQRKVLIEYEALKPQYKKLVIDKICGVLIPYDYLRIEIINRHLYNKPADIETLHRQKLREETRNRALECVKYLHLVERNRKATAKRATFPMWTIDEWWINVIAHARSNELLREKNGINLPFARARLNHLSKLYSEQGPLVVLSGRLGNKNSSKLGKSEGSSVFQTEVYKKQIALLTELRAHPNNLDFVQITDHYNYAAEKASWPTLTPAQIGNILKDGSIDLITTPGRSGKSAYYNTKAIQVKRKPPTHPLSYVTIDGWDVELAYQEMIVDKAGNRRTRYDNRLVVVVVLDPFLKYPVGYAIEVNESADLNKRAVKNALDHLYELTGQRLAPYQLQSDNYAKSVLHEFYTGIARLHTPARIGNAKSKVIEPYFKYLNKKYCQLLNNWTGFGIKSRRESQPNIEFKDQIKKNFPDKAGVIEQIETIIAAERKLKGEQYLLALQSSEIRKMTRADYLKAVGTVRERTIRANGKGLIMQIAGAEYVYDSMDMSFRQSLNKEWRVIYDPQDMSSVLIEDAKGSSTTFVLQEKYVQPMAVIDQVPEDRVQLGMVRDANKALESSITEKRRESRELVEDLMSEIPALGEFRQKLMFTYKGQQKDPLQEAKNKRALPTGMAEQPAFEEEAFERHLKMLERRTKTNDSEEPPTP